MQFWLAPLHGITNHHFRNCLNRHTKGYSTAVTPFLAVLPKAQLKKRLWLDVLPENNPDIDIIPQLIGNKPEDFVDTIITLQEFGYQRFNWNIGCPSAQVVRHQRGCGLMPLPDRVEAVVQRVTDATDCRFSIKMRLGLRSKEESIEIIHRLNRYPIDFVAVHPRLGIQQYEGAPDLTAFRAIYDLCSHPLIYSGDINDLDSSHQILSQFPNIQQCMLGRGALRNIFLAEELSAGALLPDTVKNSRFKDFYNDLSATLLEVRGAHGALSNLKELWHYFATFCSASDEEIHKLLRINHYAEFHSHALQLLRS